MMSKKKIIKGINDHIMNSYYSMVDYDLSTIPSLDKEKTKNLMEKNHKELVQIRNRLQEILIS